MKVKELIRELKKYHPDAEVVWQAHDQDEHEIDGWVRFVSEGSEKMCFEESQTRIVVLRP